MSMDDRSVELGEPGVPQTRLQAVDFDPIPLVIVEGFLGGAGPLLWGRFERHCSFDYKLNDELPRREIIFASVGPVSSLHDRACELYHALKGGTVDYGAEHSQTNGHARYGRYYSSALYPEWSPDRPLHFLGHSMGGPTITKLQWLLGIGFFGKSETPDMILSVTAVSSPFRGTQAVYTLGERTDGAPSIRPFSLGSILAKGVHVASYLSPYMPTFLDMHADARSLSCMATTFQKFVKTLRRSDWAESRDATPFDGTYEAADLREASSEGLPYPGTYYRSYSAYMTEADPTTQEHHRPSVRYALSNPPLYLLSSIMGSYDFSVIKPSPSIFVNRDSHDNFCRSLWRNRGKEALWANDGVVPVFSQWHPFDCSVTTCRHRSQPLGASRAFSNPPELSPGIWDVYEVPDASHISLVPLWLGTVHQRIFWESVGQWLRAIDRQIEAHEHERLPVA